MTVSVNNMIIGVAQNACFQLKQTNKTKQRRGFPPLLNALLQE